MKQNYKKQYVTPEMETMEVLVYGVLCESPGNGEGEKPGWNQGI